MSPETTSETSTLETARWRACEELTVMKLVSTFRRLAWFAPAAFALWACAPATPSDAEGAAGAGGAFEGDGGSAGSLAGGAGTDGDSGGGGGREDAAAAGGAGGMAPSTTFDAGAAGSGSDPAKDAGATKPPSTGASDQALIAVGYGGLRLFSLDGGRTWGKRVIIDPDGGDDENLIRGAGHGDGVWVAVGWKIFTSEDGRSWNEISEETVPGTWYDCVNYQDGKFIVQRTRDGFSDHIESTDRGRTWRKGTGNARCESQARGTNKPTFKFGGSQLSTGWRGKILLDGKVVYTDPCCQIRNFEAGFLPRD